MLDPGQWEPLLSLSFANPNLEEVQEESSYGTLLALANTCVRGLTRLEEQLTFYLELFA